MNSGNHNPHWEHLAASGQLDSLANEINLWRNTFHESLKLWMQQAQADWVESVQPLIDDLLGLEPPQLAQNWNEGREQLSTLNQEGHLLREEYLQQLGPTPLACLNSVLQQVTQLESSPDQVGRIGAAIFADLKALEGWAGENGIHGDNYERLRLWLENLGLGLLSRQYPSGQVARQQLTRLWQDLSEEHARQEADAALAGPTQSGRWNSWILLLELCEHETQDHAPVLDSLDGLDADVEDVALRLGDQPDVADLVADYREASQQLRTALTQGKRLKGWSQILPPILVDLDRLVPREAQPEEPISRVRSLCQEFEAGTLSTERFQESLAQFASTLLEGRKQSRIQTAQHPSEVAFVEALGKLQGGLDILTGVERAGQASRLEMGCTLIEDGLAQIQKLESGDG